MARKRRGINERTRSGLMDALGKHQRIASSKTLEIFDIETHLNSIYRSNIGFDSMEEYIKSNPLAFLKDENYTVSLNMKTADIQALSGQSEEPVKEKLLYALQQQKMRGNDSRIEMEKRLELSKERRQAHANRWLHNQVYSSTSPEALARETRAMAEGQSMTAAGRSMAGKYEDVTLERRLARNMRQQGIIGEQMRDINVSDPEGREKLAKLAERLSGLQQAGAAYQSGLDYHVSRGTDVGSQMDRALKASGRGAGFLEQRGIAAGVRSGSYGSLEEESTKLANLFVDLNKAIQAAKEEFGDIESATGDFRKNIVDANKEIEKQERIVSEVRRSGGGGGGGIANAIGAASGMIGIAAGAGRYIGITSQIEQNNVRAAIAGMGNQEYFNRLAATQGDMGALRRADTDLFRRAFETGDVLGGRELDIQILEAGGRGLGAASSALPAGRLLKATKAARAASKGTNLKTRASNLLHDLTSFKDSAADVAGTAMIGVDAMMGISAGRTAVAGANAQIGAEDAVYAIADAASQAFFDQRMGAYRGVLGAGGKAGSAFNYATSDATLRTLASYGVDPARQSQMLSFGVNNIGGSFASNPTGMMGRAAQLERGGLMGMQDFLARGAQMTNVGGGQGNLEEILANAVARGVDNAKAFGAMTDAVVSIASKSSGMGINTVIGAQQTVLRSMDALSGTSLPEELKVNAARYAADRMRDFTTGGQLDVTTLVSQAAMTKAFGGDISAMQRIALEKADPETLKTMMALDPKSKEYEELNERFGGLFSDKGNLSKALDVKAEKMGAAALRLLSPGAVGNIKEYVKGNIGWDKLKGDEKVWLSEQGLGRASGGMLGNQGYSRGAFNTDQAGDFSSAQRAAAAGASAKANQAIEGGQFIDTKNGQTPLSAIADKLEKIVTTLDAGKSAAGAVAGAESMNLSETLKPAADTFKVAVDNFAKSVGSKTVMDQMTQLIDTMQKFINKQTGQPLVPSVDRGSGVDTRNRVGK